jgi:hypothetical protein
MQLHLSIPPIKHCKTGRFPLHAIAPILHLLVPYISMRWQQSRLFVMLSSTPVYSYAHVSIRQTIRDPLILQPVHCWIWPEASHHFRHLRYRYGKIHVVLLHRGSAHLPGLLPASLLPCPIRILEELDSRVFPSQSICAFSNAVVGTCLFLNPVDRHSPLSPAPYFRWERR